ncbi:MAG: hypothetical protein J6T80_04430 [Paludibacteraceae bacterium]|nr:hypothetical protein [Paludibacteraceae bacterium]
MTEKSLHRITLFCSLLAAALFVRPGVAKAECPDWYDLTGSHVRCETAPYHSRQTGTGWTTQVVDEGPDDIRSRHTVHRDGNEQDARTTNNGTQPGLHTVPAGELASVRLGNWLDGRVTGAANETGQAERITYTFRVTEDNKYILLRYAIVWQDPHNHNDIVPSFQLETFLGATGNTLISGLCYNFDYDAVTTQVDHTNDWDTDCRICAYTRQGTSQGNYYYYYNYRRVEDCPEFTWRHETQLVSWRDWRTRLINLEDYVGQIVRLRFTSSDCGYVEHWGYSYFTLRCLEANLYSPTCGGPTETRTFTAPTGLNYIWYKVNDDPGHTRTELLSESSNTLTVLNDGQMYECYIASPENANCHISLYAKAEPRLPLASFTIDKHEDCVDTLFLIDESAVSRDGVVPLYPHEDVDVVTWDFGDGRSNVAYTAGTPITYAYDGTYTIKQTARLTNGNCVDDSIQTVTVRGRLTKHESEVYDTICGGKTYTWHGKTYDHTGTYPDTIPNAAGDGFCDSIVRLHLKVWDGFYDNDIRDILAGKDTPFEWHHNGSKRYLSESGVYWDSCKTVHGCDSVYRLDLRVHPAYSIDKKDTVCAGTDYTFIDTVYNIKAAKDTILNKRLPTAIWGNDSIIHMHLHVKPSYHFYETKHFCKGTTFNYHGSVFSTDGPHDVHFSTKKGCDSIYHLTLIEDPTYLIDTVASISYDDRPYIWHGKNCSATGTYYDSLKTADGCDSVIRLRITVYPTYHFPTEAITLCKDSSRLWHTKNLVGTTVVKDSVVWDSLKTVHGYDSIYRATLTVLPSYRRTITEQRAIGETYYFFGTAITTGGEYIHRGTTDEGCDSIVKLIITFRPTYLIKDTAYICEGQSYKYHKNHSDVYYTEEKVYWDSLTTVHGYDSVYRLQLYVNPVYTTPISATICQPATYDFFGTPLSSSGTYTKLLHSRSGCDSTIVLTLTVNPKYDFTKKDTICEGESVLFEGETKTESGYFVSTTYPSKDGCDSINRLQLTVLPKKRVHHSVSLCTGQSWHWYKTGEDITTNREVSDTLLSASGCDSINIWHIYAYQAIRDTVRASICKGKTYNFNGYTYTGTTVGNDTIRQEGTSSHNCDSTHILILTVNPTYYEQSKSFSLCLGDYVTFNSKTYNRGGTYYDTLKTAGCGCDSAYIISIAEHPRFFTSSTVALCKDSSMIWHGKNINKPGTYYDSLKSTLSHGVCDSVYELIVTEQLQKRSYLTATIWDNSTYSFGGKSLNESGTYRDTISVGGCDSITELVLTVLPTYVIDTTITICRGGKYLFNGRQLENGGLYTEKFNSTVYHTDSLVNLTLVVVEPDIQERIIHISDQETYPWHRESDGKDSILSISGTYDDTIPSLIPPYCDSINRLILVRHQTYYFPEDKAICQGKSYYWRGKSCATDVVGTFNIYDSLKTHDYHVDSVYHLHLTVNPTYSHDTTVYICDGDYYNFLGAPLNRAGVYLDTVPTTCCSCDSIFRLTLNIRPTTTIPTVAAICQGESYPWRGKTFTTSVEYEDTLRTKDNKCDSIYYHLSLTAKTRYEQTLPPATICANQWYDFFGHPLNVSGDYDTTFTASNHCDSTYHLHLTVNPTYVRDTTFKICTGDVVSFNGKPYSTGGNYRDTLYTAGCNCDSVYNIHIQEFHPFFHTEHIEVCRDSSIMWHGQTIVGNGLVTTYRDEHKSKSSGNLCDSIYEAIVTIHEPGRSYPEVTILSTTTYFFNGQYLDTEGYYSDTVHATSSACDSIITLHLKVLPVYNITYYDTICRGQKYDFNGKELENGGLYKDTLVSSQGTDSIVNLMLIVHEPRISLRIEHVSDQELPYPWHKHDGSIVDLNSSGVYDDSLKSVVTGCDSVSRLQLVVHQTYLIEETDEVCQNKSYTWHGRPRSTATVGTFDIYDSLKTNDTWRYDSVHHLTLTVNPIYRHDTTVYICETGDYYDFNSTHLYHAGTYYDTIKTVDQCDSTFTAKVIVRTTRTESQTRSICPGEIYAWRTWRDHDSIVSEGKEYKDTLRTKDGKCDSIYYHLTLNIKSTYTRHLPDATICDNQTYDFFGRPLNISGDYDTTFTASNYCDSTIYLHLTVNPTYVNDTSFTLCTGGEVRFNGKSYTTGGPDIQTLRTVGCNCDSVYNIQINEYNPYYRLETMILCKDSVENWHGKTIDHAGTYFDSLTSATSGHLCDSVYELRVTLREPEYTVITKQILSTASYYFNGQYLKESGTYYDTVQAVNNTCDSIIELQLTVKPIYTVTAKHEMCRGESFLFKDTTIETSGWYTRTFTSIVHGTDSTVNMNVIVHEPVVNPTVVHISDKQTYTWHRASDGKDSVLSISGSYDDTLQSKVPPYCDSINRVQLFVHRTYLFNQVGETCEGKAFRWRDNDYPAPTAGVFEYYDSLKTHDYHVDSVYHLTLTVNSIYRHDTTVSICAGDYYDFNGTLLYSGGTFRDTLPSIHECDSMFKVTVHVRPTRVSPETQYICPGSSYTWHGKTYSEGNEYEDTLRTTDGLCDSIYYHLTLRLKTKYERDVPAQICSNELPYDFHGRLLYQAGDYDTTFTAITTLCDSVIHLHLTVNQAYDTVWYDTICRGQSVLFDNLSRSESGTYVYHGQTRKGCDSIVTLYLTVIEKQNAYIEKHLCEGDYFEVNGEKITQSGTYTETAISQFGCDSTTNWHISVHKHMRDTTYAAICEGKEYLFHGVTYRAKGTYVHEDRSRYNCDSTYVLVLSVNPTYSRDTAFTLCENDYFTYNGNIYRDGGYIQDTARTKGGCNCDSILNMTITKHPVTIVEDKRSICRGETYTWHGETYTRGGYYYDTLKMKSGLCDSIVYCLKLTVNSDFYQEQVATICNDTYFAFRGRTYNESGIYYDSLTSPETGCDSIYCLKLTVNPTYRNVTSANICDIDPYWYNGHWLTETGDYVQALQTSCGCDSTSILHLVVTPTKRDSVYLNICESGSITYMGRTITETGTYRDTVNLPDLHQCLISILEVGFYTPTIISNVIVDNICADDAQFQMRAYYSGNRPTTYSLVFDDHARAEGFKNILNQPFEDVIVGPVPQFGGTDYVRPDYYKAILTVNNDICSKSEQAHYEVQMLVRYPSWIIEQNWNDVVALLNENFNGGYRFSKYEWIVNENPTGNELSYLYLPTSLGSGDAVSVALTRQGENYSVPSCPIVIYDKTSELVSEYPVLAHPTQVRGQIRIVAQTDGEYALYTTTGALVTRGNYRGGDQLFIQTHVSEGCYLLRLSTQSHGVLTKKIILR